MSEGRSGVDSAGMGVSEALSLLRGERAAPGAADVDVGNPDELDRGSVEWPRALLAQVRKRTDDELAKDAALIEILRAQGWSLARIARKMGQDVVWVRQTRKVARQRNLVDGAVQAARAEVEDMLDLATDNVRKALRKGDKDMTLAVVRGTGVLSSEHAPAVGSMTLQVTFVQTVEGQSADGPVVSVQAARQDAPLGLVGVVGAPNSTREAFLAATAPPPTPRSDASDLE